MQKAPLTFDQLPGYVYELGLKVDQLLIRLNEQPVTTTLDDTAPLNVKQAAELLNIAPQTVYQRIKRIPHTKRFGKLYFNRRELLDYLNNGKEGGVA